jgi:D-alanyl-D-alanine carboxypeptidase (penicillin-binding protein 5/6)
MKLLRKKDHFLFLTILAFIFISSTGLVISDSVNTILPHLGMAKKESKKFPSLPVLVADASFPVLSAQSVLAVDLDSGVPLYEKNPSAPLLPASTTKIITALVSLDTYILDQVLTVPKGLPVEGQKMGLHAGEQMSFENLLKGLLIYSANDAAKTLAFNYPGGYDAFVAAMNVKASAISMTGSHFENPIGLDGSSQKSTARDLIRASEVAMGNPVFSKIVGTKQTTITDISGKIVYNIKNINELLESVPGVLGVKTGWTENARENLVTYIERDGRKIMIAILGSQDRFGETKELINWIFTNYKWEEVAPPYSP